MTDRAVVSWASHGDQAAGRGGGANAATSAPGACETPGAVEAVTAAGGFAGGGPGGGGLSTVGGGRDAAGGANKGQGKGDEPADHCPADEQIQDDDRHQTVATRDRDQRWQEVQKEEKRYVKEGAWVHWLALVPQRIRAGTSLTAHDWRRQP